MQSQFFIFSITLTLRRIINIASFSHPKKNGGRKRSRIPSWPIIFFSLFSGLKEWINETSFTIKKKQYKEDILIHFFIFKRWKIVKRTFNVKNKNCGCIYILTLWTYKPYISSWALFQYTSISTILVCTISLIFWAHGSLSRLNIWRR